MFCTFIQLNIATSVNFSKLLILHEWRKHDTVNMLSPLDCCNTAVGRITSLARLSVYPFVRSVQTSN